MSTRSYVGKLNADGTVRAIYVHWDGYLEYVGQMLLNYYNDEATIDKLLDLGDISSIGERPIGYWQDLKSDSTMCKTYRERGELGVDAKDYSSVDDYLDSCCEDFTYLFKDGAWYYRCWDDTDLKLVPKTLW